MAATGATDAARHSRRRRLVLVVAVPAVAVVAFLAAGFFVPVHSESHLLGGVGASGVSASFSVPQAAWVTVHFSHPGGMAMRYWMMGSGGGMMMDRGGMAGSDTYSFGTWGGTYECWAQGAGGGVAMPPVWANVTWGFL